MTPQELARHANILRVLLDLVTAATDERNDDESRLRAAEEIAELSGHYKTFAAVRETFRDIANHRTDGVPPPPGWA